MGKDRENALIENCKRGDLQAMEQLIIRYEQPVFNAAYRILGNPEDAADVTQAVFLKAIEHLDSYNAKFKFFSWIYRIACNESVDQLKRRRKLKVVEEPVVIEAHDPGEEAQISNLCDGVQGVLMELQDDYRTVIVLRHFSECSYQEISDILEIPVNTVKSRLYSARQLMKEKLQVAGFDL